MKGPLLMAAIAMALCGCDRDGGTIRDGTSSERVPASVQTRINGDFPADGRIHVQPRGRFRVEPTTLFCAAPSVVDRKIEKSGISGVGLPGISDALEARGQSPYLNGTSR